MTIVLAGCTGAWLVGPVSKMPETEESESIDMDPAVPPFIVVAGAAIIRSSELTIPEDRDASPLEDGTFGGE